MLTCGIMLRGELQKLHALKVIHQRAKSALLSLREHMSISNTTDRMRALISLVPLS